jgi:hypothetical protein
MVHNIDLTLINFPPRIGLKVTATVTSETFSMTEDQLGLFQQFLFLLWFGNRFFERSAAI